jgi:peptidoglycan/xylan/chitin deacetylase (PgdA/CDA1 family)
MSGGRDSVLVLTYHSISSAPGPTSIDAATFRMQMDTLAECGYTVLSGQEFLAWHGARDPDPGLRALITFDDGFADFATTACPVLRHHGFGATVFVPTGKLGGREDWRGANDPARPLLDWTTLRELAQGGVEFGGHGVTHADLTRLAPADRRREIEICAQQLAEHTGRPTRWFAAPYGHVNAAVRADLAATYEAAFGTRLDSALPDRDRFDVPRIEMHYFRQRRRWQDFLRGDRRYFLARRALRWGRLAARAMMRREQGS